MWFPVVGAVEDGETLDEAAVRETGEETGFEIGVVGPPLFTRGFQWVFDGTAYDQEETCFLVRISGEPPTDGRWSEVEKATIVGHRWWTVEELRCTDEAVYPEGLADILERFL